MDWYDDHANPIGSRPHRLKPSCGQQPVPTPSGDSLVLAGIRWWAARNLAEDLGVEDSLRQSADRREFLPEGHQPPPGLSPLSPSERLLSAEATCGLADLEGYLLDAA